MGLSQDTTAASAHFCLRLSMKRNCTAHMWEGLCIACVTGIVQSIPVKEALYAAYVRDLAQCMCGRPYTSHVSGALRSACVRSLGKGHDGMAYLVHSGLHIACVCGGHGLQSYGMLTAHLHLPNLHRSPVAAMRMPCLCVYAHQAGSTAWVTSHLTGDCSHEFILTN